MRVIGGVGGRRLTLTQQQDNHCQACILSRGIDGPIDKGGEEVMTEGRGVEVRGGEGSDGKERRGLV